MRPVLLSLICSVAGAQSLASPQGAARLEFADKIRLVTCDPVFNTPCFRLKLSIVDANGAPMAVALPAPKDLARNIEVTAENQQVTPFYASASGTGRLRQRVAMILIDTSGSMNEMLASGQSRFAAAKAAAEAFAEGFAQGSDRIAVAPFASRDVVLNIRNAKFAATAAALREEIETLPAPLPRNNTALYSAVDTAIDVLRAAGRDAGPDAELLLLVLTDGHNDVQEGDDPGLLTDDAGLALVSQRVKESGIQAIGVGLGDGGQIDEAALRQISTKTYFVNDPAELKRAFSIARVLLNDRLEVTFSSPWKDRATLAGRNIAMSVSLRALDGRRVSSSESVWQAPDIGEPVYEARCSVEESRAALATTEAADANGWLAVLRPVIVFLGFSLLFFVLWFWAPRLIWPDRYLGDLKSVHYRRRWSGSGTRHGVAGPARRERETFGRPEQAPPGFGGKQGAGFKVRTPSDATYVQPRADMMGTRTRLNLDLDDK
jgi:Mg-chelatase subunit ChlD